MKALILYGSPHGKNSATYRLGSSFAKGLKDQGWAVGFDDPARQDERANQIQATVQLSG